MHTTGALLENRKFVLHERPLALPDASHFKVLSEPLPVPACGEVLVRVLVAALSPWQNQRLKDFKNYAVPFAIGELIDCDVLGEVLASEVAELPVGQLVTGRLGWQEYALAKPGVLTPVSAEFPEVIWLTALSSPGLTAYTAMDLFARPMPGQTMAVTSAAGAVGTYAVQLARLAGMRVIGIAGGAEKCDWVKNKLGADECIDHRQEAFAKNLAECCGGDVHLFFDTVGGPIADTVFDQLAKHATVVVVGRTRSNNSERPDLDLVNMRQLWAREATVHGFSRYSHPQRWAFARERMMGLFRAGKLHTCHHEVEGFEQTPQALHDMLCGKYMGKTLVRYARPSALINTEPATS